MRSTELDWLLICISALSRLKENNAFFILLYYRTLQYRLQILICNIWDMINYMAVLSKKEKSTKNSIYFYKKLGTFSFNYKVYFLCQFSIIFKINMLYIMMKEKVWLIKIATLLWLIDWLNIKCFTPYREYLGHITAGHNA